MAAKPRYIFVIKDKNGNLYEFERAVKKAWEWYENDVGRCRFLIPGNDLKLSSTSVPEDGYSEILIYRNGALVWQGVTQVVQDTGDGCFVYGETFMAALGWYGVRYNQAYSSTAVGTIITNEYDNIETRSSNFLTAKITQGTIQNPYQSGTTNNLTITRTLFHENFLTFLKQMVLASQAEMTTTWDQNAVFNINFSETAPTFTFYRNVGVDQSDVVFELDSEIVDFNIPRDMRGILSYSKGLAIASGPTVLNSEETDATVATNYYRREFYPFFNNVNAQGELDSRTNNFLYERKDPRREMKVKLAAGLTPFDGYSMGDSIRVRINAGRVSIDEYRRVIGMEVSIGEDGVEETVPILQKRRS